MNQITAYSLEHLAVLTISGKDTVKFLQGQCTQDINLLIPEQASPGAFCNAKGRAITNVWLMRSKSVEPIIHLCCHRSSATRLAKHLSQYIAFFRGTQLTDNADRFKAFGLLGASAEDWLTALPEETTGHFQCQAPDGRWLVWLDSDAQVSQPVMARLLPILTGDDGAWQVADIHSQTLWLTDDQAEKWIPQNFSLDRQGGISFKKGCYTGQEVIARLHFKGASKKSLCALRWSGQAPSADGKIYQGTVAIGDIVQTGATETSQLALAIVKIGPDHPTLYADNNQQVVAERLD